MILSVSACPGGWGRGHLAASSQIQPRRCPQTALIQGPESQIPARWESSWLEEPPGQWYQLEELRNPLENIRVSPKPRLPAGGWVQRLFPHQKAAGGCTAVLGAANHPREPRGKSQSQTRVFYTALPRLPPGSDSYSRDTELLRAGSLLVATHRACSKPLFAAAKCLKEDLINLFFFFSFFTFYST